MTRPRRTIAAAILLASSATACGVGSAGALDQVAFAAECEDGDADCRDLGLSAPLAVGTTADLDLAVIASGTGTPSLVLEAARPEVLAIDGHRLVGLEPGMTALLASGGDGVVIDFVHVAVEAPDRLALVALDPMGSDVLGPSMQMLVGDDLSVMPTLMLGDQRLLGTGDVVVSVEGDAVDVLDEGLGARRRLAAREPGAAEITVTMLETTTTLTVEVLP